ncbi:IS1 family transposase [Piscirickettsia litoralis]|uniref:IS1 family transposase n=1 Tax=Piscirickettsia litoralis TaxID=1891921 RepID=UPI00373FCB95
MRLQLRLNQSFHCLTFAIIIPMIEVLISVFCQRTLTSLAKKITQAIERKHLILRTRIKLLARKIILFSKSKKCMV